MKRTIKIRFLIMVLVCAVCLNGVVYGADQKRSQSKISEELQELLEKRKEPFYKVMLWLNEESKESISDGSLRTVLTSNDSLQSASVEGYMENRKVCLKEYYSSLTDVFAKKYLDEKEILYCSEYTPAVTALLSEDRISVLAKNSSVSAIDYYCDNIFEDDGQQ